MSRSLLMLSLSAAMSLGLYGCGSPRPIVINVEPPKAETPAPAAAPEEKAPAVEETPATEVADESNPGAVVPSELMPEEGSATDVRAVLEGLIYPGSRPMGKQDLIIGEGAYWSAMTVAPARAPEVRAHLEAAGAKLIHEDSEGERYSATMQLTDRARGVQVAVTLQTIGVSTTTIVNYSAGPIARRVGSDFPDMPTPGTPPNLNPAPN